MRRLIPLVTIILTATAVLAQGEDCDLRYKFVPGQVLKYLMTSSGTVPMDINPGPEAALPALAIDMALDMTMHTEQLCKSVDAEGQGLIETTYPVLTIRSLVQVPDQPVDSLLTWENGVLKSTVNGQAQPQDDNQKKLATILASTLKSTVAPTGKATPDAETAKLLADLMAASGGMSLDFSRLSALTSALPGKPTKVGDTWQVEDTSQANNTSLSATSSFKLAGIETLDGVRVARIEGEARMSMSGQMPAGNPGGVPVSTNITRLDLAMTFVNYLDLEQGNMLLTTANLCQNMAMVISMGEGPQAIHLPATIENAQMTLEVRRQ